MPDREAAYAFIGLGSNLDDPVAQVRAGMAALGALPNSDVTRCSSLYRSAPVGFKDQPDFINAVCLLKTHLSAAQLLRELLAIERKHGRVRGEDKGGPRILDLDLLLYDRLCSDATELLLPHPRLHERAFVLYPLLELDPELHIPKYGRVSDLIGGCSMQAITKLESGAPRR